MDMTQTQNIKVINTTTKEEFVGKLRADRKSSYLIWFEGNVLPFSKKTGKIFGKNVQDYNYQLIMGA